MKSKYFLLVILFFFTSQCYAGYLNSLLAIDGNMPATLPPKFRLINDSNMHVIGSGQFSKRQLIYIKKIINAPIIIVDLRQESHGFVNGLPVSWFGTKNWANKGKSTQTIDVEQQDLLNKLKNKSVISVAKILTKNSSGAVTRVKTLTLKPQLVYSERYLAQQLGLGYIRFYVTDHSPPSLQQLQSFKKLVAALPKNTWIYLHCRAGVGRTTTFMLLYAIIKRGKAASLQKIINRQISIGGKDLEKLPAKNSYKYPLALQRENFIKAFYRCNRSASCK